MSVQPVQIVIVKPEGYLHAEAFRELAESLLHGFEGLGIPALLAENEILREGRNLVLGWHLLRPEQCAQLPSTSILYNLEQLDDRNEELRTRLAGFAGRARIWDYSLRNIEILRDSGFTAPIALVPIGYVPQLSRIHPAADQDIDVLFYGSANERRLKILRELETRGSRVHHAFGAYGAERDALIARAKVVLNLHYYDSSIFEMVRVSYLLANRKAVVAECHLGTEVDDDIRRAAVLVPYEHLVDACLELAKDAPRRQLLETRALETIARRDQVRILGCALDREGEPWRRLGEANLVPPEPARLPAVSVVVITRNRPGFLRRALQSIQEQRFRDFEVIVVNDGGEDVTGVVDAFGRRGLAIKLRTHAESRGQSAARNTAMNEALGRWIAYLDDDDLYYPEHLGMLVKTLQDTGAWVAYSDSLRVIEEEQGGEWVVMSRELAMSHDFQRDRFLLDNLTPINNVMHERACWEICGPHDESLPVLEDWDYWIRLSRRWDFVHVPKVTAEVRWRASGANVTFERQALFPECRRRIAAKVAELLIGEKALIPVAAEHATKEALIYEPDWSTAGWVEVLLSYFHAFAVGEPVALILPLDPDLPGQLELEEAQVKVVEMAARAGYQSFADVILVDKLSELLDTLKPFARSQWIPAGRGSTEGLTGEIGTRFAQSRRRLSG